MIIAKCLDVLGRSSYLRVVHNVTSESKHVLDVGTTDENVEMLDLELYIWKQCIVLFTKGKVYFR